MIHDEYSNPTEETPATQEAILKAKQEAYLETMAKLKQIETLRAQIGKLITALRALDPRPEPALFHALGLLYMAPQRIERKPFFRSLDQVIAEFKIMTKECMMNRSFEIPSRLNQLMRELNRGQDGKESLGISVMKAIYKENHDLETIGSLEYLESSVIVSLRLSDNLIKVAELFKHSLAVDYLKQLRKEEAELTPGHGLSAFELVTLYNKERRIPSSGTLPRSTSKSAQQVLWGCLTTAQQTAVLDYAKLQGYTLLAYSMLLINNLSEYGIPYQTSQANSAISATEAAERIRIAMKTGEDISYLQHLLLDIGVVLINAEPFDLAKALGLVTEEEKLSVHKEPTSTWADRFPRGLDSIHPNSPERSGASSSYRSHSNTPMSNALWPLGSMPSGENDEQNPEFWHPLASPIDNNYEDELPPMSSLPPNSLFPLAPTLPTSGEDSDEDQALPPLASDLLITSSSSSSSSHSGQSTISQRSTLWYDPVTSYVSDDSDDDALQLAINLSLQ